MIDSEIEMKNQQKVMINQATSFSSKSSIEDVSEIASQYLNYIYENTIDYLNREEERSEMKFLLKGMARDNQRRNTVGLDKNVLKFALKEID